MPLFNNEILAGPERYNILDNVGASLYSNVQIALATGVTQAGTPLTAALLNLLQGLPSGTMINGKIAPSVASNNLTLALKTLAGNDPSASDPVIVNIGGAVRVISAALSVTKNAATNWCNAGGAELATKEVDYFAYLGYNATDGVVIGFSRIPYATIYSTFSVTTTNERYAAISTITNAAASDEYQVIGRFAATLSAGAGYTWSVPSYTAANLVQRPVYETRWMTWVPTVTSVTGTITTVGAATAPYQVRGMVFEVPITIIITTNGTAASGIKNTLPFTNVGTQILFGKEVVVSGKALTGTCGVGVCTWLFYDGTHPGANGAGLIGNGLLRLV